MRKVVLESPYKGNIPDNVNYAKACIRDCLSRGEAPIASHLLLTQDGILDDNKPQERVLGIEAGHAWTERAEAVVVYVDKGISSGMRLGIDIANKNGVPVEYRSLFISDYRKQCLLKLKEILYFYSKQLLSEQYDDTAKAEEGLVIIEDLLRVG
jgi:hypothetical protein